MDDEFGGFLPGHQDCPYHHDSITGIGGLQGPEPEDFVVEELPAYDPSGTGDHWFLKVRKRSLSTPQLVRILARQSGCAERDIGVAGRKDTHAVTTQWISLPCEPQLPEDDRVEFIDVQKHGHKLRLGHSKGNRFTIRWLDVNPEAKDRIPQLLNASGEGVPNYFGPQRFGREARGVQQSRFQLQAARGRKNQLRFATSVLQGALFNQWLGQRVRDGFLHSALEGDVLKKRETGGLFECTEAEVDAARVRAGEIDPTGPIYGPKMWSATGAAGEREDATRQSAPLTIEEWDRMARLGKGSRRVSRVVPGDIEWALDSQDLTIQFSLPPGAYATVMMAFWTSPRATVSSGST